MLKLSIKKWKPGSPSLKYEINIIKTPSVKSKIIIKNIDHFELVSLELHRNEVGMANIGKMIW